MKAILQEQSLPFGRSHNLIALLELLLAHDREWENTRAHLEVLSVYAVTIRYPGESADKAAARQAMQQVKAIRIRARRSLSLPA